MFHTELTVCSIGTNLEPLIIENIDFLQYNHKHSYHFNKICKNRDILSSSTHLDRSVHKPPWISSKIGLKDGDFLSQVDICHGLHMIRSAITYCTRAPSARQLQILLLLHLFQAVQARDDDYGVDVDDLGNPRRSDDANAGFYSNFRSADGTAILEDDSDDDEDDNDDLGDEDDPSDSPSTVAVISAAKSSPILNLWSSAVLNLSTTELPQLGDSDQGFLLIQRMVQATLISGLNIRDYTSQEDAHLLDHINHE
jgi:hypothetical protein